MQEDTLCKGAAPRHLSLQRAANVTEKNDEHAESAPLHYKIAQTCATIAGAPNDG